jgi:hypothetical protein
MGANKALPIIHFVLSLLLAGCADTAPQQTADSEAKTARASLWRTTCSRCHNLHPPDFYKDYEWDVVLHHMRVRAHLTPQEEKAILDFLKAGN